MGGVLFPPPPHPLQLKGWFWWVGGPEAMAELGSWRESQAVVEKTPKVEGSPALCKSQMEEGVGSVCPHLPLCG